jgi:hypothetical protein
MQVSCAASRSLSERPGGELVSPKAFVGIALATFAIAGCGAAVYQPSRTTGFELDQSGEINDDDVRKAFEARPQMRDKVNVAYYSFDPTKADDIEVMLKKLPGVVGTYRIPSLLATGQKRFGERRSWDPPVQFSMKKLRLLAARAHCDLLVVLDYGNKVETSANGLTALSILVLPPLFLPMLDVKVQSAMDSYVMDTRNGYLYAHVDAQKESSENYITIYSSSGERFINEHWPQVLADTSTAVRGVLETERSNRHVTPSAPLIAPSATAPMLAPPATSSSAGPARVDRW